MRSLANCNPQGVPPIDEAYLVAAATATIRPPASPRLLDQVRASLRAKHYSYRTEQAYVHWIRRFILFHDKRHPREIGAAEIERFLTYLAVAQSVAVSTQNQALSALLFLYQRVLESQVAAVGGGADRGTLICTNLH